MDLLSIGNFIAQLRKQNGLTQEQLGEQIGVTNKTVSRWETGVYMPPADALMKMSELFGVTVNELLSGKRPPQAGREKPWLLTCTANACKDRLRAFGRKRTAAEEEGVVLADDLQRDVWTAVRSLRPKYRAVVHLYYYEGYAQDEIAEILHISRTAVQTRMSRAREKLKEVLKDE